MTQFLLQLLIFFSKLRVFLFTLPISCFGISSHWTVTALISLAQVFFELPIFLSKFLFRHLIFIQGVFYLATVLNELLSHARDLV